MRVHILLKGLALIASLVFLSISRLPANPIPVRQPEGLVRGFLVLRDMQNNILASGDLFQTTVGPIVTADLVFHFEDGSLQQEIATYSQRHTFQLLTYHEVQKGPSFKHPTELSINVAKGLATVRQTDAEGKEKTFAEHMKLPADLANGILTTVLLDVDPAVPKTTLSMVVPSPKPRLVKLEITPAAEDSFTIGGVTRKARSFTVHIDIGGIAGIIAPLVGKQPPDIRIWISSGKAPGFLKSEGPLYDDGPIWRIELASPVWR